MFHTTLLYKTECWGARLVFSRKPGDTSVYFNIQLEGIGQGSANEPTSPASVPLITPLPSGRVVQNTTAPDWSSIWSTPMGGSGQTDGSAITSEEGIHIPAEWTANTGDQPPADGPSQTD